MKGSLLFEYLTTYGWLILIIAIVGTVLFFFVPPQHPKSECIEGNLEIPSTNWRYEENGDFVFKIGNKLNTRVEIVGIEVTSGSITKKTDEIFTISPKSESKEIVISGLPTGKLGNKVNVRIKIIYRIPEGISGNFSYLCNLDGRIGE